MRSKTIFLPQIGYEAGGSSKEIVVSGRLRYRVDPMGKERGMLDGQAVEGDLVSIRPIGS